MSDIQILGTGLVYRNPKPHVHSIQALFPSVVYAGNGEMLATVALAEAFEAVNMHTHVCRSHDFGETWQLESELYEANPLTSDAARIAVLHDGTIVALVCEHDRGDHPEEGLTNPENLGFVPTRFLLLYSTDNGRSWSEPHAIDPPEVGPSFELCSPIVPLRNGRWLLPTSTWRSWEGLQPQGKKMLVFMSHDQGDSWPEAADVMSDPDDDIFYWESKVIELPSGVLVSGAWAYNEKTGEDLPNQYAVSKDEGITWSQPRSTGLIGQTMSLLPLDDGRILAVYRRMDESGLWANLSHLQDDQWGNDYCKPLWGADVTGLTEASEDMSHNFNVLRFGAPCVAKLPDHTVFVTFWCYEECVSNIRWFKLKIT